MVLRWIRCVQYFMEYAVNAKKHRIRNTVCVGKEKQMNTKKKRVFSMAVCILFIFVTFASLFTLVAMLSQNKAIIAVACILFSFGLLFAGAMCNRMLDAPKTIPAYSIGENGENTAQEMENPKYLDGTKREIVQFIYDVNPGGQAIQCSTMQVVNLTRLPIYSLVIVILTTGAGVWIFKKKDLK